ncbi:ADP-ribosylglycohydrolase family protein [Planomonospora corallina]|uniref:ADP-ribosylglycohydrolase family protein n=1 Tax=Planomonospora corallina TaxID=1806052 RepID=A0ABV8IJJ4_9ACTN
MNDPAPAVPYGSRVRGCLLGGAVGDALGNPVEFDSLARIRARYGPAGLTAMVETEITDDTQMTLFTAEGLIRARLHSGDPLTSVSDAYLRWLDTQSRTAPPSQYGNTGRATSGGTGGGIGGGGESGTGGGTNGGTGRATSGDAGGGFRTGWLRTERWLYARRAPGNACLSGLRSRIVPPPPETPLAHGPVNPGSKGCGTVMRSAPFGLLPRTEPAGDPALLAVAAARLTHGHPTAAIASGALAHLVSRLVAGDDLAGAVDSADEWLSAFDGQGREHRETREALRAARKLAEAGDPSPEKVETLGGAWIAEEALAIAVYCALAEPDPRRALLLAVNHSGDADSTGAICGNIIGAAYGEAALPANWAEAVEGRRTILRIADDLVAVFGGAADDPAHGPGHGPADDPADGPAGGASGGPLPGDLAARYPSA